jgi:Tol biopolymer transport system component
MRTSSRPGGAVRTIHAGNPVLWAPGGRIVFWSGNNGNWYSIDLRGGKPKRIVVPSGAYSPIVTPNREYLAFITNCGTPHCPFGIALLKLTPGRNPVELSSPGGDGNDRILGFSPDGKQLVFSSSPWTDPGFPGPPPGPPVLMAVRLSDGNSVPLAQSGIPGGSLVPNDVEEAHWSSDGRWVAFVEGPSLGQAQTLEVVPTTGETPPRVLGTCPHPGFFLSGFSWSPTSKLIAYDCTNYLTSRLGSGQLMTVKPDGTDLTNPLSEHRLTPFSYYEGEPKPQWSPDGSRLLFLAQRFGHRSIHVWTIRPDGHDLTRLG